MSASFILRFLVNLYNGLFDFSKNVLLWLDTPVNGGIFGSGTIGTLLFGGAVGVFLAITLWKWLKDIVL